MRRSVRILLMAIGTLLVLNGPANIVDDARVLTYDITSILCGLGFMTAAGAAPREAGRHCTDRADTDFPAAHT